MYVRAKRTFNYGGIVAMVGGEHRELKDDLAKILIKKDLVAENKLTHKRIKVKKNEPLNKADNSNSEQGD